MRSSRFYLLLILVCCLPLISLLLAVQCHVLLQDNRQMRESMDYFEKEYQSAQARAERLENLEALLQEEGMPGRELLARQLAKNEVPERLAEEPEPEAKAENRQPKTAEDLGHDEYPAASNSKVSVSNVHARVISRNFLRIGFDLKNTEDNKFLRGKISALFISADGKRQDLNFSRDMENFAVSRFKRVVTVAQLPRKVSIVNAQIMLELKSQSGEILYSDVFPIQRR